ncbi:hypothetical protein PUNSTDRAFT_146032 [Punctularia strigosozonata HHB-11173 SS5]|uniref:Uncharacterized protein n=1 Tax=Punctularia strigosozonata (strain HHB-11173) TaxID=741275 RepID=R7S4H0_PUNST|nr:uncharacterized protein PUNSTDRAFT_146032 [Punctularia strigosozonata HHB-11173 SS5]EIN05128.1 hypothetical protein PUNSTDRAFT_146032 [Punctularia strigosozonata HHB-11173 SS5]
MLGQAETATYLEQCGDELVAIEEVLSAYVIWKFLKGHSCPHVLQKLHYLCIYLRVTGRTRVLSFGRDVFKVIALEVAAGGGRLGVAPVTSPVGKEIWNRIRREVSKSARQQRLVSTDAEYGGPAPAILLVTPRQLPLVVPPTFRHVFDPMMRRNGIGQTIDPEGLEHARATTTERWFRSRPQFGNTDAPDYTSDVGTLPRYHSQQSRADESGSLPPDYASRASFGEVSLLETPPMTAEERALIRAGLEDVARVLDIAPTDVRFSSAA